MKDNPESLANWATVVSGICAVGAIFLSMKSYVVSHDAISVAKEANVLAQNSNGISIEANRLASEATRTVQKSAARDRGLVPAIIYVVPFEDELTVASIGDLRNAHLGMMINNVGTDSIDMVRFQVFTIFTLKDGSIIKQKKAFSDTHEQVDCHFAEYVRPGGMAKADLTTALLKLLATADFGDDGDVHSALFNVKCTGRPVGYAQPTGVGLTGKISSEDKSVAGYGSKNCGTIKINWHTKTLSREQILEYAKNYETVPWISNK